MAIENIKAGDKVISTNAETFDVAEKTVVEAYVRETTELVRLKINGEIIKTTPDHPFYVKDVGFVGAGELYIGDKLLDSKGNILLVEDMKLETTEIPTPVYNFQVEDLHTYHVGENGIWVHNSECGGRYADLKKTSDSSKEQVHHMSADSSSPLSKSNGVAIKMDIVDHKRTASFDRKPGSDAYRKTQAKLIKEGNFQKAFDMDVVDIQKKFPGKYDENIAQAQSYLNKLIREGKVT